MLNENWTMTKKIISRFLLIVTSYTVIAGVCGVDIHPKFQIVKVTDDSARTRLPCDFVTNSSDRPIIEWYRGGTETGKVVVRVNTAGELKAKGNFTDRVILDGKGSIFLDSPKVSDTSNYTCFVLITADIPPTATSTVFLNVTKKACVKPGVVGPVIFIVLDALFVFAVMIFLLAFNLCKAVLQNTLRGNTATIILCSAILVVFVLSLASLVLLSIYLNQDCAVPSSVGVWKAGVIFGSLCICGSVLIIIGVLLRVKKTQQSNLDQTQAKTRFRSSSERGLKISQTIFGMVIHDQTQIWLSRPGEQPEAFVKTRATEEATRILDKEGCVVIIGNPGDGKTSLGKHLLSHYQQQNYKAYLIHSPEEWRYCWDPNVRQLFMVDDAFGRNFPNESQLDSWLSLQNELEMSRVNAKFIFISTKFIYRKCLLSARTRNVDFWENVVDLRSAKFCLNREEKTKIIDSHCADRGAQLDALDRDMILDSSESAIGFPVLCRWFALNDRLGEGEEHLSIFSKPVQFINEQLHFLQTSSNDSPRYVYGLLVLIMLNDGKIPLSYLDSESDKFFMTQVHAILNLLGLSVDGALSRLSEAENSVLDIFLTRNTAIECVTFCHESTLDVLATNFGGRYTKLFLQYGVLSLVSKYIRTISTAESSPNVISLDSSLEKELFHCFWNHISRGEIRAVFEHQSLSVESFQKAFILSLISEPGEHEQVIRYESEHFGSDRSLVFVSVALGAGGALEACLHHCQDIFSNMKESHLPLRLYIVNAMFTVNWYETGKRSSDRVPLASVAAYHNRIRILKYLETVGCDIFAKDGQERSPMHHACYMGNTEMVRYLLQRGFLGVESSKDGETPLHSAASKGHTNVVQLLLKHGANSEESMIDGSTALLIAAKAGYVEVVRIMLEHTPNVSIRQKDGYTALHAAALEGHVDVVKVLLENGAELNDKSEDGSTALHLSASEGHEDIVQCLLHSGDTVSAKNNSNYAPIHLASMHGHSAVVNALLSMDANPNCIGANLWSPLHAASFSGNLYVANLLLDYGADVAHRDGDGNTPVHIAAEQGYIDILQLLANWGGSLYEPNGNKHFPLHLAVRMGHLEIVRLLAFDNFLNAHDCEGKTPLHLATVGNHHSTMEFLLHKGADSWAKDNNGKTAMHHAAGMGNVESVWLLAKGGSPVTELDDEGRTPLHIAAHAGHRGVVKFFINHGVDILTDDNSERTPIYAASTAEHLDVVTSLSTGARVVCQTTDRDRETIHVCIY